MKNIYSKVALGIILISSLISIVGCSNQNSEFTNNVVTTRPGDTVLRMSGILPDFDLGDLVKLSDAIYIAKVLEILPSQAGTDSNGRPIIYTDIIFNCINSLLSNSTQVDKFAVRVSGGRVGSNVMIAEDAPVFNKGEELILFVYRRESFGLPPFDPVPIGINSNEYYGVVGSALGKWKYQDNFGYDLLGHKYSIGEIESKVAILAR